MRFANELRPEHSGDVSVASDGFAALVGSSRLPQLRCLELDGNDLLFRFNEEGRFPRSIVQEFADRLGIGRLELNRTHWAVKDGSLPGTMLERLQPSYDVVFSFAGENRDYVERVADYLRSQRVRVFYDQYEEVSLWGKDLAEHFDFVYRRSGRYCVMFISKSSTTLTR